MDYFYALSDLPQGSDEPQELPNGYEGFMWRPGEPGAVPPGADSRTFQVWWLFHKLRIFANRDYSVYVITRDGRPVHRSCVFPRYFRFPFMAKNDLQIGDTWTDPSERGKGLATYALTQVVKSTIQPDRKLWYVVENDNIPSIKVVKKAGFGKVGTGIKTKRLGLGLLGAYVITSKN